MKIIHPNCTGKVTVGDQLGTVAGCENICDYSDTTASTTSSETTSTTASETTSTTTDKPISKLLLSCKDVYLDHLKRLEDDNPQKKEWKQACQNIKNASRVVKEEACQKDLSNPLAFYSNPE